MTWYYTYTPLIWPSCATAVLLISLVIYSGHRRSVPGALPFMFACLFGVLWAVGNIGEYASAFRETKIFWVKFEAATNLPVVTAITCFLLEYAWPGRWLTRRNLILFSIPCLFFLALVVTNDPYQLIWRGFISDGRIIPLRAPVNWIAIIYAFGFLGALNLIALAWLFRRSSQHRWPVLFILFGQVLGRTVFSLDAAGLISSELPVDILGLDFELLMYTIALFGYRLFDPLPQALRTVIAQMREGMLVLDPEGRVTSMNPSAEAILGIKNRQANGRPILEVLPSYLSTTEGETNDHEISIKTRDDIRSYLLETSDLKSWRGRIVGRLLLLHDITARKKAEAALRESEEILRLIYENASDGIAIYEEFPESGSRKLLDCNERYAQMSGRSRQELFDIGNTMLVQKILPSVEYAQPRQEISAAQSVGFFSWDRPDGKENIIEYNAVSVRESGRLLTIGLDRDVTERQRAQAQVLEQRWAQATQHEREQLAHELHDGLSQSLGFVNLQAQASQLFLATDQVQAAQASLSRLSQVAQEIQEDIRDLIGNLLVVSLPSEGFCTTLRHIVRNFEEQNGMKVSLDIRHPAEAACDPRLLPASSGVQLIRIVQEALTNVRKHARGASEIMVHLSAADNQLRLVVSDNGVGFDLHANEHASQHYGLQIMHSRTHQIGGQFSINSIPGQGTRIELHVPLVKDGRGV